jgi:hypothetical protein
MGSDYEVVRCPSCGAPLPKDVASQVCGYCKAVIAHPGGPPVARTSPTIEAMRPRSLPAGWVELQFGYAADEVCAKFAQSLGGGLRAVANQHVNASAQKLQVNYVHAVSLEAAQSVFRSMVKLVGKSNTVARKGDVVIEIICQDRKTAATALQLLAPEEVHR